MYLFIDPSLNDTIHLALFDEHDWKNKRTSGRNRDVLMVIEQFLQEEHLLSSNIQGVAVVLGVGGFTSTRLAVVLANTLGYALHIPVLGISLDDAKDHASLVSQLKAKSFGEYISAAYSAEPNVGRAKDKDMI